MIKKVVMVIFLFCFACTVVIPSWVYRSSYNPENTDEIISLMKDISNDWGLRYAITDKDKIEFLMHGKPSFQMFLYYEDDAVVSLLGVDGILSLMVVDFGDMPIEDLNRLKTDIMDTLNNDLGIKFELYEKPKKD